MTPPTMHMSQNSPSSMTPAKQEDKEEIALIQEVSLSPIEPKYIQNKTASKTERPNLYKAKNKNQTVVNTTIRKNDELPLSTEYISNSQSKDTLLSPGQTSN